MSSASWFGELAGELNRHGNRQDGMRVAECLTSGLNILRDSLYARAHQDVETFVGKDSLFVPLSEIRTQQQATEEIEVYVIAESSLAAKRFAYMSGEDEWFLEWLARLRWGQLGEDQAIAARCRAYLSRSAEERRRHFTKTLAQILPESGRAPLVVFRLMPLAVQIATACAFGDRKRAQLLRQQQTAILPAVADCRQCHGRLLECDEQCRACGNPLWKYNWLIAAD